MGRDCKKRNAKKSVKICVAFSKAGFCYYNIFYYHLPLSVFETCVEKGLLFM